MTLEIHPDKPLDEGVCGRIVPGHRVIPDRSTERFQTEHIAGQKPLHELSTNRNTLFAAEASPPLNSHSIEARVKKQPTHSKLM